MGKDFNILFDLGELFKCGNCGMCKMQSSLWINVDYHSATEQGPNVFRTLHTSI